MATRKRPPLTSYTIRLNPGDTFPTIGKSIPDAYLFRPFAIAFVSSFPPGCQHQGPLKTGREQLELRTI